ncbi:adenylate/guanylate cyclase domain-containing protein [Salininema proteolyticum]|uniref:Adenylate/guanylate cyclase domain-containing protein n=1 Tax=Salininema proteolyticum TaxID=1607685 RepID=A0ABV8TWD2_9ACTN
MPPTTTTRPARLPSGFLTFAITDIEGSTPLAGELGDDDYAELIRRHRCVIRSCVRRHGGHEVETEGDSFLLVFTQALDAVRCAIEIQLDLAAASWPRFGRPHPVRPRVRIALHSGHAMAAEHGYDTIEIHKTARICSVSHGDQIVASEQCRAAADFDRVSPLGDFLLKGLKECLTLHQVHAPGLPEEFAPPPVPPRRHNLPQPYSQTIAHGVQLGLLNRAHRCQRLITLSGLARSGRTTTVLAWARNHLDSYLGGIWYVPQSHLGLGILSALGRPTEPLRDPLSTAIDHLRARHAMVILDGPRTPPAADIERLLDECPNVHAIVCAPEKLGIAGEAVIPLRGPSVELCARMLRQLVQARGAELGDTDARRVAAAVDCFVPSLELVSELVALSGAASALQQLGRNPRELFRDSIVADSVHRSLHALTPAQHGYFHALVNRGTGAFTFTDLMRVGKVHRASFGDVKRLIDMTLLIPGVDKSYRVPLPVRWMVTPSFEESDAALLSMSTLPSALGECESAARTPAYLNDSMVVDTVLYS